LQNTKLQAQALTTLGSLSNKANNFEDAKKYLHDAMILHENRRDDVARLKVFTMLIQTYRLVNDNQVTLKGFEQRKGCKSV
jgi:uncharacterized protein HemY